jgi:hypothetical protein
LRVLALLAQPSGEEPTKEELERRLLKHHESTSDYERGEERRRFHDLIDPRLCLYRLRAEALLRRPRASDMVPRLMDRLRRGGEEPWRYGQGFDFFYRDAIPLVVDAALACLGDIEALLDSVTEEIERKFAEAPAYRWIDLAELLISRPEHTRRALLLLDQAANHLHEHPTDGEGHCGALLRAASLAQPRDSDQARDLFHRAVAVAREMNDDLSDRMGFLARAAQGLGSELDEAASRDLAAQLARLTEETRIYVRDGDRYPWESVLHAVLALHPPSGYALFARWSELGHLVIRADMHELALGVLELGALTPTQALALLRLSGDGYATSQAFLAILDAARQPNGSPSRELRDIVASTVRWVLRDLDRDERPSQARRLQKWLVQNGLGDWAEARALQEYLSFDAEYPRKDGGSDFEPIRSTDLPERSPFDWAHFFGSEPVAMRLTERFEALQQVPDGYALRGDFFSQARKRLLPSERATYLQALVELPDRRLYRDEYLDEWEHCLSDWRHIPSVQQWAEVGMLELARRHLPGVLGYQYQARESLERLLRLPFVQPAGWLDLLGPALSDWVERLESWQLYLIAEVLALGLSPPQRRDLLIEALGRGEQAIESRRGVPLPPPPSWALYGDDRRTPLATLLHILLGEPDTRIRWSCLHALREMRLQDDTELLAALMARLDVQDSGGFLPADTRFLWISARAYLLIFVARFAQDHPQPLLPHAQTLLRHALSTDFPHAQIRELARRALLAVTEAIPGVLDDDALRRLDALHEPVSTETTAEHRMWGLADTRSHDGRFSFCSMDTLPYWYAPLGRRFGINADAVAAQAETWICDRWGIFGNQAWEVRRRRFSDRDWGLASNRHGSLPTIESYQLYLEYHAMHLVAGQLIDSRPLIKTRDDWESASWEYWLAPHLPTMQRHWLSELRDPVPLEPALHGRAQPPLPSWLEPELPAAFDRGLGLTPCGRADRLIVAARVGVNARDRRETQQVESALVSPQTAHSLLRALQSIGDPHAYRLPPAGDDLEIDEPGFVLTGWIGDRSHENQLDGRDPLLHLMSTGHSSFPRAVQEALGVQTDAIGKRYLEIQRSEVAIAEISAWSDLTHDTEYAEYSEGWRLWISIDRLLEYLRDQQRCLIIEFQIDREQRREERRGFGFSQYKPPATLIYILHPDGHLESLVHHCCLGSADR